MNLPPFVKEEDRVLIRQQGNVQEVLVFPEGSEGSLDFWMQQQIVEKSQHQDKIMYSKGDAIKLEKFLLQEGSIETTIKKKCLKHSSKCETCDILSRQDHRKEGKLMSQTWDNVTASKLETINI